MEWTIRDTMILASMAMAVIGMSFVFPAVGLTDESDEVGTADVPEFSITTDRFEFADDLPDFPTSPTRGVLNSSSTKFDDFRGSIQTEIGDSSAGNRTFIVAIDNDTVHLTDVEASTIDATADFNEGDTKTLSAYGYDVDVHAVNVTNSHGEYEYEITKRPGDSSFLSGLFNVTDAVAGVVGYIAISFIVISQLIIQFIFNAGFALFQVIVFVVDLLVWLVTTYESIVSGAAAWAAVFVLIPSIILFAEFAKLTILVVKVVYPFA